MNVSERLSQRIDVLGNSDAVDKLRASHSVLKGQIASGDVQKAAGTAKALGAAIARLADQAKLQAERKAQRFQSAFGPINLIFYPRRYKITSISCQHARADAFGLW